MTRIFGRWPDHAAVFCCACARWSEVAAPKAERVASDVPASRSLRRLKWSCCELSVAALGTGPPVCFISVLHISLAPPSEGKLYGVSNGDCSGQIRSNPDRLFVFPEVSH